MTALTRLAKMVFSRYQILMDRASDLLARFSRIVAADGYDRGLQPVQWQALMFLRSANRFSRTPKALTAWLGQTKGSVSQTIAALEKKGLITRRTDPDDQRVVRLDLTEAGTSLVAGPPPALATQMLGHLTAAQRDSFAELVEQMLRFDGFEAASIEEVIDPAAASGRFALCVRYQVRDQASLDDYLTHHAPRMREDGIARFADGFKATRRILQTT